MIQLEATQVEIYNHQDGSFALERSALVDESNEFQIAGTAIRIEERWANSAQEFEVTDDGVNPLHAIELSPSNGDPAWIGQTDPAESPPDLGGVFVRVLPEGDRWLPTESALEMLLVTAEGEQLGVPAVGSAIGESEWAVASTERFERATVDAGSFTGRGGGPVNPAFVVHLAHPDGSRERHVVFERFHENIHKTTLEGGIVLALRVAAVWGSNRAAADRLRAGRRGLDGDYCGHQRYRAVHQAGHRRVGD